MLNVQQHIFSQMQVHLLVQLAELYATSVFLIQSALPVSQDMLHLIA